MSWFCLSLFSSRKKKRHEDDPGSTSDFARNRGNSLRVSLPVSSVSRRRSCQGATTEKPLSLPSQGSTTRALFAAASSLHGSPSDTPGALGGQQGSLATAFRTAGTGSRASPPPARPSPSFRGKLPSSVTVHFGRISGVPVNQEGDAVEDRTFFCSVYLEEESATKGVDNPERITNHVDGFYSGIKHYDIPFSGQTVALDIPAGLAFSGFDPLTGGHRTLPSGFRVALIEQLATGNQVYKGSTPLLHFDDTRILQMQKWPLTNPNLRQGAGFIVLRCDLRYHDGDEAVDEVANFRTVTRPVMRPMDSLPAQMPGRCQALTPQQRAMTFTSGDKRWSATEVGSSFGRPLFIYSRHLSQEKSASQVAAPRAAPPVWSVSTRPTSSSTATPAGTTDRQASLSSSVAVCRPLNLPPVRPCPPRPVLVPETPQERLARTQTSVGSVPQQAATEAAQLVNDRSISASDMPIAVGTKETSSAGSQSGKLDCKLDGRKEVERGCPAAPGSIEAETSALAATVPGSVVDPERSAVAQGAGEGDRKKPKKKRAKKKKKEREGDRSSAVQEGKSEGTSKDGTADGSTQKKKKRKERDQKGSGPDKPQQYEGGKEDCTTRRKKTREEREARKQKKREKLQQDQSK
ncbi:hypothetical protein CSUI_003406 [Cystoisospora suis]|uniref:Uncharacterized protein n=1 Tax=Cystoisospora suis TaxID=483139 RepID=A0A2C6L4G4_9APIC|nr:hypothetical protein CSUI_003406 [Cystoisospora suis]